MKINMNNRMKSYAVSGKYIHKTSGAEIVTSKKKYYYVSKHYNSNHNRKARGQGV